jgi:hypothetical protein
MGLLGFGTSQNSLQSSQQTSVINDMVFNFGDDNDRGATDYGSQSLTPTQSQKEELGLSASVAVAGGKSGTASLQRKGDESKRASPTFPSNGFLNRFSKNELIMGFIAILGLFFIASFTKMFKFKKG